MNSSKDFIIEGEMLIKYTGRDSYVVVPDGVKVIGPDAFYGCFGLSRVVLPDSVIIHDMAFFACTGLKHIHVPESVGVIGYNAFFHCEALKEIILPKSLEMIVNGAFTGRKSLTSIIIPDSIEELQPSAFSDCTDLTEIYWPASIDVIGPSMFKGCTGLKHFTVPEHIAANDQGAFSGCSNLAEIIIPESVKTIGASAFSGCSSLTDITIPKSVETIGTSAFSACTALRSITFNGSAIQMEPRMFKDCKNLHEFCAPNMQLSDIKNADLKQTALNAFIAHPERYADEAVIASYIRSISSRKEVCLPMIYETDNIAILELLGKYGKIKKDHFDEEFLAPAAAANAAECVAWLLDFKAKNITETDHEKQFTRELEKDPNSAAELRKLWSFEKLPDGTLCITNYKGSETEIIIPERIGKNTITAIGDEAFHNYKDRRTQAQREVMEKITSITLPKTITSIGNSAFRGCKSLKSIVIPEGVKAIGDYAFSLCHAMEYVEIPDSVTQIGESAFEYCHSLKISNNHRA